MKPQRKTANRRIQNKAGCPSVGGVMGRYSKCRAPGCTNVQQSPSSKYKHVTKVSVSMFRFPRKNLKLREEWCKRCCISIEGLPLDAYLCPDHFDADQFSDLAKERRRLIPDALPRQIKAVVVPVPPEIDPLASSPLNGLSENESHGNPKSRLEWEEESMAGNFDQQKLMPSNPATENKDKRVNSGNKCKARMCNTKKGDPGVSFFRFPVDHEKYRRWCQILDLDEERLPKVSYICCNHFSAAQFLLNDRKILNRRRLNKTGVPDQNIYTRTGTKITRSKFQPESTPEASIEGSGPRVPKLSKMAASPQTAIGGTFVRKGRLREHLDFVKLLHLNMGSLSYGTAGVSKGQKEGTTVFSQNTRSRSNLRQNQCEESFQSHSEPETLADEIIDIKCEDEEEQDWSQLEIVGTGT